jgi:hypothetical protein
MKRTKNNPYNRPNKVAIGFMRQEDNRKKQGKQRIGNPAHPDFNEVVNTLCVRGTLCKVLPMWLYRTRKTIYHPTDPTFTKEVFILNDKGKQYLNHKKRMKIKWAAPNPILL